MNFIFPIELASRGSREGADASTTSPFPNQAPNRESGTPIQATLAFILDQLVLRGHSGPGPIQSKLRSGRVSHLSEALSPLSSAQKTQIRSQLGSSGLASLLSLAEETDPQIFFQDLFHLGEQCQRMNRPQVAALIFQILIQTHEDTGEDFHLPPVPRIIRQRAQENLDVLSGEGPFGRRLEFQAQRFVQGATAPSMIVGMAVGSTVFTTARSMMLPRLLASRSSSFFANGFGARLTASSFALIPEVGAFWITSKGIEEYLNPGSQTWNLQSNLQELAGLTLTLGLLKSTGFVFGRGHQWAGQVNRSGRASPITQALAGGSLPLWHQTGMFGGIVLAHGMEINLGWRPEQSLGAFLADSLITLAQFNIGGRLSQGLFPGLYQFNAQLNGRVQVAEKSQWREWVDLLEGNPGIFHHWRLGPYSELGMVLAHSTPDFSNSHTRPLRSSVNDSILLSQKLPDANEGSPAPATTQGPVSLETDFNLGAYSNTHLPGRIVGPLREFSNLLIGKSGLGDNSTSKLSLQVVPLREGEFQITFSLPEIKIQENGDPPIGKGFEEIVSRLQGLGWGPLLIKTPSAGPPLFRFLIPREIEKYYWEGDLDARQNTYPYAVDIFGQGPETNMERMLREGFFVPPSSLPMAIPKVLQELPGGPNLFHLSYDNIIWDQPGEGSTLSYRRMELLHRVLVGPRKIESVRVTENGVGMIIDTTVTLARMGGRVQIKEPDALAFEVHQGKMHQIFPDLLRDRVEYIATESDSPSDIVYWINPGPNNIGRLNLMGSGDYLGRDLETGGLAVVQTDHRLSKEFSTPTLSFHPHRWEKLFEDYLPPQAIGINYALPTAQNAKLFLQVYRKLSH